MCDMCWYDFDTHLDMAVSSLFTLQNTATATTPAMAAVNRTPPIKPPTAALTPVLKQPQATHAYMCVGRIAKNRASIDSYILAFAEWARNMSNMLMQAHFNTICKGCRSSQLRRRRGKRQRITK